MKRKAKENKLNLHQELNNLTISELIKFNINELYYIHLVIVSKYFSSIYNSKRKKKSGKYNIHKNKEIKEVSILIDNENKNHTEHDNEKESINLI